jgi:hypothetical protein
MREGVPSSASTQLISTTHPIFRAEGLSTKGVASGQAYCEKCGSPHFSHTEWNWRHLLYRERFSLTRGCAAGHRQECLCHILSGETPLIPRIPRANVAQTLLSVPSGAAARKARQEKDLDDGVARKESQVVETDREKCRPNASRRDAEESG